MPWLRDTASLVLLLEWSERQWLSGLFIPKGLLRAVPDLLYFLSAGRRSERGFEPELPNFRADLRRSTCISQVYPFPPTSYPPPLHQVSKLLVFSDLREACAAKFPVFRTLGSGGLENKGVKNLLETSVA